MDESICSGEMVSDSTTEEKRLRLPRDDFLFIEMKSRTFGDLHHQRSEWPISSFICEGFIYIKSCEIEINLALLMHVVRVLRLASLMMLATCFEEIM